MMRKSKLILRFLPHPSLFPKDISIISGLKAFGWGNPSNNAKGISTWEWYHEVGRKKKQANFDTVQKGMGLQKSLGLSNGNFCKREFHVLNLHLHSDEEMPMAPEDPFSESSVEIFDREVKRNQRDRASFSFPTVDNPLQEEITERLLDRLEDCKRSFPIAAAIGGSWNYVSKQIKGRGGVKTLIVSDSSENMLQQFTKHHIDELVNEEECSSSPKILPCISDDEFVPLKKNSVDLIICSLGLHWVNDLPGFLSQCRMCLKEDGLFLGAMLGGETLKELRIACTLAQMEREGGISNRISPLAQVRDAGNLLTRAQLSLPTVDVDSFCVHYPSAIELIDHLRAMAENNAIKSHIIPPLKRDTAMAAASIYQSLFGDEKGNIPATFQVIFMAGWSPHVSQSRAKVRGSGTVSLKSLQQALQQPKDVKI